LFTATVNRNACLSVLPPSSPWPPGAVEVEKLATGGRSPVELILLRKVTRHSDPCGSQTGIGQARRNNELSRSRRIPGRAGKFLGRDRLRRSFPPPVAFESYQIRKSGALAPTGNGPPIGHRNSVNKRGQSLSNDARKRRVYLAFPYRSHRSGRRGRRFKSCHSDQIFPQFPERPFSRPRYADAGNTRITARLGGADPRLGRWLSIRRRALELDATRPWR
jgi:hypothetical protein